MWPASTDRCEHSMRLEDRCRPYETVRSFKIKTGYKMIYLILFQRKTILNRSTSTITRKTLVMETSAINNKQQSPTVITCKGIPSTTDEQMKKMARTFVLVSFNKSQEIDAQASMFHTMRADASSTYTRVVADECRTCDEFQRLVCSSGFRKIDQRSFEKLETVQRELKSCSSLIRSVGNSSIQR